jgi:hypothetical protein
MDFVRNNIVRLDIKIGHQAGNKMKNQNTIRTAP